MRRYRGRLLARHPPDLIVAGITQLVSQQPTVPLTIALRRFLVEQSQDTLLGRFVVDPRLAGPGGVVQASQTILAKPLPPFGNLCQSGLQSARNFPGRQSFGSEQNHARALHFPMLASARPRPRRQSLPLFVGKRDSQCSLGMPHLYRSAK
jgi:hypothetical protein